MFKLVIGCKVITLNSYTIEGAVMEAKEIATREGKGGDIFDAIGRLIASVSPATAKVAAWVA